MLQEIVADDLNILIYLNYSFRDSVFFLLHLHDTCSPVLAIIILSFNKICCRIKCSNSLINLSSNYQGPSQSGGRKRGDIRGQSLSERRLRQSRSSGTGTAVKFFVRHHLRV